MKLKEIEFFFVGNDIQLRIDHTNKDWFDEYNKLLVEDIDGFLQDNDFIEDSIGIWRDTNTDKLYSFNKKDIALLKRYGRCKMFNI